MAYVEFSTSIQDANSDRADDGCGERFSSRSFSPNEGDATLS